MTTDTWHHQLNILKLLTHLLKIFWTFWGSSYELCADLDGFANPYRPMGDTGLSIYISPVAGRRNMQECSWHFSFLVTSSWWLLNGVKSSNLSSWAAVFKKPFTSGRRGWNSSHCQSGWDLGAAHCMFHGQQLRQQCWSLSWHGMLRRALAKFSQIRRVSEMSSWYKQY